ncbi:glycerol kinase GlpK [Francisella frigiditurris]|uniref:Glycerol kinase n=1 Tax=Francisella frigiditurris TaxID=1542390 RepID=A0A1J0KSD2_9GAMM|nr:glycerol kinase GlpK [Francisella frigiditurris]APC96649.1 glycerol kinase [Francisella frigiditurris]
MSQKFVLAVDQGTTSSRAIIFDNKGGIKKIAQKEFTQIYPKSGWVEHDPMEIWGTQSGVLREVLESSRIKPDQIAAIGITNQRETVVVWDKETGDPIYNAIVWQCRRTSYICDEIKKDKELTKYIKENTGLVVDAYFSGTKVKWILDNVEGAREKAEKGQLLLGTIDTWLIWNMTRGQVHATDYSNASRTMLFNINTLEWDKKILKHLGILESMLPEVKNSSEIYGHTDERTLAGARIPIAGVAGDQHAALFGHCCFEKGMAKNTYGTGCFALMNVGDKPVFSDAGLLTTIAWGENGKPTYALEGSVFIAGAVIQWIRDGIGLIRSSEDSEYYATKIDSTNGVYFVPAFVGLGTPYWDMYARGTIVGITRDTKREHIIRAALEAIAYQAKDVLDCMKEDTGLDLAGLKVDGGAVQNSFLMQFQADILQTHISKPEINEITGLGAVFLAGLAVGFWKNKEELKTLVNIEKNFEPKKDLETVCHDYKGWKKAVERSKAWAE